jgi:hypothetical protein
LNTVNIKKASTNPGVDYPEKFNISSMAQGTQAEPVKFHAKNTPSPFEAGDLVLMRCILTTEPG